MQSLRFFQCGLEFGLDFDAVIAQRSADDALQLRDAAMIIGQRLQLGGARKGEFGLALQDEEGRRKPRREFLLLAFELLPRVISRDARGVQSLFDRVERLGCVTHFEFDVA